MTTTERSPRFAAIREDRHLSTAAFVSAGVAVTVGLVVSFLVHPKQPKRTE